MACRAAPGRRAARRWRPRGARRRPADRPPAGRPSGRPAAPRAPRTSSRHPSGGGASMWAATCGVVPGQRADVPAARGVELDVGRRAAVGVDGAHGERSLRGVLGDLAGDPGRPPAASAPSAAGVIRSAMPTQATVVGERPPARPPPADSPHGDETVVDAVQHAQALADAVLAAHDGHAIRRRGQQLVAARQGRIGGEQHGRCDGHGAASMRVTTSASRPPRPDHDDRRRLLDAVRRRDPAVLDRQLAAALRHRQAHARRGDDVVVADDGGPHRVRPRPGRGASARRSRAAASARSRSWTTQRSPSTSASARVCTAS